MSLKRLFVVLALLLSVSTYGQTWNRNYLIDTNSSIPNDFFINDSGSVIVGAIDINYTTKILPFLIRTNVNGDTLWTRTNFWDSIGSQNPVSCTQLKSGNILVGITDGIYRYALIKFSPIGAILSKNVTVLDTYPGNMKAIGTSDNGYYVIHDVDSADLVYNVGYTLSRSYIEKYDSNDVNQWQQKFQYLHIDTLPSNAYDAGDTHIDENNALLSYDGGLIYPIKWDTITYASENYRYLIQKTNANGVIMWTIDLQNLMGLNGQYTIYVNKMFNTSDSGFVVDFYTTDSVNYGSYHLVKFNSSGAVTDSISIGNDCWISDGVETSNGRLLFNAGCGSHDYGYVYYNKHLQLSLYIPSPFPFYTYTLYPNSLGGAFTVSAGSNNLSYIRAINFDSLFNTYPSSVSGNLVLDKNDNCITDNGDLHVKNDPVILTDAQGGQWFSFTDDTGHYKVNVPAGNYTLSHRIYGYKAAECPQASALTFNTTTPTQYTNTNLYDTLIPNRSNIGVSMYAFCFVPGYDNTLYIDLNNYGTVTASTTLTFITDPAVQFLSSTPAPSSVSGDTLRYTISSLLADSALNFTINLHTPTTTSAGQSLTFHAQAPFANDLDTTDNYVALYDTVVSSYNPNEKTVNQPLYFNRHTGEMIYAVQFQNTGTYYAKNVVVVDTIDNHLDLSTFRLIHAAPLAPAISWWEGNKLLFTYNNIMLPDSTQSAKNSIGNFVYGIKPKSTIQVGDTILNTAYIYFDFNVAIATNTTMNIVSTNNTAVPVVRANNDITVYPNPSSGVMTILLPQQATNWTVRLTDIVGKETACSCKATGNKIVLSTVAPQGIYLLQLTNTATGETTVKKITVIR